MKAIVWGTVGAIAVRVVMTLIVVALLKVPGPACLLAGCCWSGSPTSCSPRTTGATSGHATKANITGFWAALRTIVIADAVMGLDNVLGVAGAAQGSFLLVVLGLLISIPIMVWGSTLILRMVDRFPVIVYIGAAVLAWTAAAMLLDEPLVQDRIAARPWVQWATYVLIVGGVLAAGWLRNRKAKREEFVLPEEQRQTSAVQDRTGPHP